MSDPFEKEYRQFIEKTTALGFRAYQKSDGLIYHYTGLETTLKIIQGSALKFSSPSEANDPFELTNSLITVKYSKDQMKEVIKKKVDGNRKMRRGI